MTRFRAKYGKRLLWYILTIWGGAVARMFKLEQRIKRLFFVWMAVTALGFGTVGCEYFPESTFELATESRLPNWFSLAPGLARSDVSVTMSYYVKPWGSEAIFMLHDMKGAKLGTVRGKAKGLNPEHLKASSQRDADGYPMFETISANGITEVIEHKKMEPKFYVMDRVDLEKDVSLTSLYAK